MVQEHKHVDEVMEEITPPKATRQEVIEDEPGWQPPMRQEKPASRMSFGNSGGIGKMALVSLVVAILVMLLLGMMGGGTFVTKKDFETNMANMAVSVNEATASVNAAVQGLPNTVSSTVNNAISQQTASLNDSINKMNGTVANLQSSVSQVSNDVGALSAKIDEEAEARKSKDDQIVALLTGYDTRIKALETVKEEEAETKEEIKKDNNAVKVKLGYGNSFDFPVGFATKESTLYFQVDNNLDYDIENVTLELIMHSRGIPIALSSTECKVSGGYPLQWQKVYVGDGVFVIAGITPSYGDGLSIGANDDTNVYVTVTLGSLNFPTEAITFYVEGKVTDYDIVE